MITSFKGMGLVIKADSDLGRVRAPVFERIKQAFL